jgi:hypothetical protein
MNTSPLATIKGFLGKNNVADSARFPDKKNAIYLSECQNVDIDDQLMAHRRDGYPATPSLSGTGIHSLWADAETCLMVQNGDLKSLSASFVASTIKSGVGHSRMNYVRPADDIYLTNGSVIGYIRGGIYYDFTAPTETYKSLMKPGHLIEWFNGRLYVARGGDVWHSDAIYPGSTDERKNFKQLGGYVSLLRAVKDGIYVSNSKETYFLAGLDPGEATLVKVASYPAILGSDVQIDGDRLGLRDSSGRAVLWLSPQGICAGLDGGQFINLTQSFYRPTSLNESRAMLRLVGNFYQYLVSQKS